MSNRGRAAKRGRPTAAVTASPSADAEESSAAKCQRLERELSELKERDAQIARNKRYESLKRLVDVLLPKEMRRNGTYAIESATIHSDLKKVYSYINCGLSNMKYHDLAQVVFTFRSVDDPSDAKTCFECRLELINDNRLVFHCRKNNTSIKFEGAVQRDLDAFEDAFHSAARAAHEVFRTALGLKPTWCYILLAMLLYNEHVFDSITSPVARTAEDTMDACNILAPFWGVDMTCDDGFWFPFIVRLMTPEFALRLDYTKDCEHFLFNQ